MLFDLKFDNQTVFSLLDNRDAGFVAYCCEHGINVGNLTKRDKEKQLVSYLLQTVFTKLSIPDVSYTHGVGGQPLFREGIKGSITHCGNYAAVLVSTDPKIHMLGIDLEHFHKRNFTGIAKRVLTIKEVENLADAPEQREREIMSLFSAKETIFKAHYPLVKEWFGFQEAQCVKKNKSEILMSFIGQRKALMGFNMPVSIHYLWQDDYVLTYLLS
ncbi:MAG: 4'-phosphopantetheinyl transferase superfamily protein [Deltaproteobacteria bacterium]|nr:4'-phosphopantetheinyl transferase superfamily protein [Deltaproteobacteria bacterium]